MVYITFGTLSVLICCLVVLWSITSQAIGRENYDFEELKNELDVYKVECERFEYQLRFWRMQAERLHYEWTFKTPHDERKCALGCGTKTVFDYEDILE